jgi:hypothetical protein
LLLGHDGQGERRNHEQDRGNGGRFREDGVGAAGSENRLRSHATECTGQIRCLTTLEQHNDNEKEADHHVNKCDRNDSVIHTKIQYSSRRAYRGATVALRTGPTERLTYPYALPLGKRQVF